MKLAKHITLTGDGHLLIDGVEFGYHLADQGVTVIAGSRLSLVTVTVLAEGFDFDPCPPWGRNMPRHVRITADSKREAEADAECARWRWLTAHDAEVAKQIADRISLALGCGDGLTEPAATLDVSLEVIGAAMSAAHEHEECAKYCNLCGRQAADQRCEPCHGSGCGAGTASGAYEECEWCAGAGWVHVDCPELGPAGPERLHSWARQIADRFGDDWEHTGGCQGDPLEMGGCPLCCILAATSPNTATTKES